MVETWTRQPILLQPEVEHRRCKERSDRRQKIVVPELARVPKSSHFRPSEEVQALAHDGHTRDPKFLQGASRDTSYALVGRRPEEGGRTQRTFRHIGQERVATSC